MNEEGEFLRNNDGDLDLDTHKNINIQNGLEEADQDVFPMGNVSHSLNQNDLRDMFKV